MNTYKFQNPKSELYLSIELKNWNLFGICLLEFENY